jgi:hypothetical protein
MKRTIKALISIILVLSMMLGAAVIVTAAPEIEEEYLQDLRLIYADSYAEATVILGDTALKGYKLLNSNLNANTGKKGVWLAYKTTTNVDDAITDIAIMQMGGGYNSANYQAMIQKSRDEYLAMGRIYLDAIDYFAEAYESGNFLAESAYRQLNFYAGLDKYPEDRLGDLFVDGALRDNDLATLFFEGNVHVLNNVRSLLAMGVSYNEDGTHYLEKAGKLAKEMGAESTIAFNQEYNDLSKLIAPVITVFRTMFEELASYEDELNYENDEFTDLEIKYAEYKAIADMMRAVEYLGGKTLYDFCMGYSLDTTDYTSIYPLAAALNEGQIAMTKVSHYYDVVRYSMTEYPEDQIDSQIAELEAKYEDGPVNVFLGVDRDVYKGTFALTSAAYRADAYTESSSLMDALFGENTWKDTATQFATGALGIGLSVWAIVRTSKGGFGVPAETARQLTQEAVDKAGEKALKAAEELATETMASWGDESYISVVNSLYEKYSAFNESYKVADWATKSFGDKLDSVKNMMIDYYDGAVVNGDTQAIAEMSGEYLDKYNSTSLRGIEQAKASANLSIIGGRIFTGVLYVVGIWALTRSAINLYNKIYDHYHPTYDEIPVSMVDLVRTADGDRYIKYDVVYEAQLKNGEQHAADLNAYQGERWNAVYYTKSSEAGKPLVADFEVSNNNNRASDGYLAVHRFGEVICYDLNKYNFSSSSETVFLSIRQSENQKSDVTSVPDIIGALFGTGFWLIAGSVGVIAGVGCTLGTQHVLKNKKKSGETDEAENPAS